MKFKPILTSVIASSLLSSSFIYADQPTPPAQPVPPMSPEQQKQVEKVVHDYLMKNPNVIFEAIQALQQKQMDEARKNMEKTQVTAPKFADALFHQGNDPSLGNPNGKVTIVDFFDYQCPHCTKMTPVLESIVNSNPNVRIVFKEFPIRGPVSEVAARMALAAKIQGKYFEFHKAVMKQAEQGQQLSESLLLKIAQSVGLNVKKLQDDMKGPVVSQEIKQNTKLAQDLLIMGTPAFFVAKTDIKNNAPAAAITFLPGQVDQAQLTEVIKKISG